MTPKYRIGLCVALASLGLDQFTKYLVSSQIHYGARIPVIDGFFYLSHVRNPGAAFGLFATAPEGLRMTLFVAVAVMALGILGSFFRQLAPGDRFGALALGLVFGGAIGNMIDRMVHREVVDFLQFRLWRDFVWPDFNVADSSIVIGVGLLVLEMLTGEGEKRAESAARAD